MKTLLKVSLRFGLIAAMIGLGLLISLYYLDRHPLMIPVYLDFRIILFGVFIFFTLREIRDYHQNGILYFWQGIFASFLFTLCYAFISSGVLLAFMSAVPGFVAEYISLSVQNLRSLPPEVIESIGRDVYERNLDMLPGTTAMDLSLLYFSQSLLISLFISIILSVVLRRQPST